MERMHPDNILSRTARRTRDANTVRLLATPAELVATQRRFQTRQARKRAAIVVAQVLSSPLGKLLAASDATGICALQFVDGRPLPRVWSSLRRRLGTDLMVGDTRLLRRLRTELAEYFAGRRRRFSLRVSYRGTSFQQAVWDALREIPYGATASYADGARRVGRPRAQRAVGAANHSNQVAILIPCHRVVKRGGGLGGYGGGLWRKRFLLRLEGSLRSA